MNLHTFMVKHYKHQCACFTVYRFLKGGIHLQALVTYTTHAHHEKLLQNIKHNNPLHEKLAKTRATMKYLPPS